MSYVRRVLQADETVVYTTRLHWLIYLRAILLAAVAAALAGVGAAVGGDGYGTLALHAAAAIFALFALSSAFRAFVRRATTELAITDRRVIYKAGLLARHTLEMNRGKVESVDVDQTVLGRLFGYGTIILRGTGGSLEPIRDITDPLTFRTQITAG